MHCKLIKRSITQKVPKQFKRIPMNRIMTVQQCTVFLDCRYFDVSVYRSFEGGLLYVVCVLDFTRPHIFLQKCFLWETSTTNKKPLSFYIENHNFIIHLMSTATISTVYFTLVFCLIFFVQLYLFFRLIDC